MAVELVETRLAKGPPSGYEFLLAEQAGEVVGYACFGPNSLTVGSWDLYWIAVSPALHGNGIGRLLLGRSAAACRGCRRAANLHRNLAPAPTTRRRAASTSKCGYRLEAVLEDFYAPGDSKAIYVGHVGPPSPPAAK